jgi:hypothetical protein
MFDYVASCLYLGRSSSVHFIGGLLLGLLDSSRRHLSGYFCFRLPRAGGSIEYPDALGENGTFQSFRAISGESYLGIPNHLQFGMLDNSAG